MEESTRLPGRKTLLLVDDDSLVGIAEKALLEKRGYKVILVSSGEKALERFSGEPGIDLVLMDIDLGEGMDGTEAASRMLELREVPILFLSSHSEPEIVGRTEAVTSYGYVTKSSEATVLDASIRMAFRLFEARSALLAQEERYKDLFENAVEGLFRSSLDGRCLTVNRAFALLYGWDSSEAMKADIYDIGEQLYESPTDRERLLALARGRGGEVAEVEARMRRKNGESIWVRVSVRIAPLAGGGECLEGTCVDITARKLAEQALQESREALGLIIDTVPQSIFWKDMEGRYLGCNKVFSTAVGFEDPSCVVGLTDFDLPWPRNEAEAYRADDREVISTDRPKLHILEPLQEADGRRFWIDTSKYPLHDSAGKAFGVLGVYDSIAEKRRIEERIVLLELEQSERRYRSLFNSLAEGFAVHELVYDEAGNAVDYRFLDLNPAFESLTGLSREAIVGKRQSEVLPGEDPYWLRTYARVVETGEPIRVEHLSPALGRHYEVFAYKSGRGQFAVIFTDITGRKAAEERERRTAGRLRRLVDILQHQSDSVQGFLDYALSQALELTESHYGYIYHYDEDAREFTLNTWSKGVLPDCQVVDPQSRYALDKTGIWGEAVRQRKPFVLNDFAAPNPLKRGHPEGHVRLERFMSLPVMKDEKIVGVVGLANKKEPYDEDDLLQSSLLMDAVWKVIERMKAEDEIKRLLAEKQAILSEVHHRIKNNMNSVYGILAMQASAAAETEVAAALTEAAGRVKSLMLIYQKLYQATSFETLKLDDYLGTLARDLCVGYRSPARLELELGSEALDPKRLQLLGIMVNELITNALKYAFGGDRKGWLRVSTRALDHRLLVTVEDDGPGLPESARSGSGGGFGLSLVRELTAQLEGEVRFHAEHPSRVEIDVPL